MIALLRYQAALLVRSQRWLPPVILYAAVLGIGVQTGQPVLDSLGYAAAAVLPVAAWLVRICATNEPPAARSCVSAAAGPARAHLACLLVAFGAAALLGVVATVVVTVVSDPASTDHRTPVPVVPAGRRRAARRARLRPARHGRRSAHDQAAAALDRPGGPGDAARGGAGAGGDRVTGSRGGQRPGDGVAGGGRTGAGVAAVPRRGGGRGGRGGGLRAHHPPGLITRPG